MHRPKIVFFAPILEHPPAGGPQISVINAIKVLNQISELHIVTTAAPERVAEASGFFKNYCHALAHAPTGRLHSSQPLLDRVLRKGKRMAASFMAPFDVAFLEWYADQNGIDIFWIDRVLEHAFAVFKQLRRRRPNAVIVGDTEAVYSRFILRELPLVRNRLARTRIAFQGRRKQAEERRLTALADVVTAVSEVDADYFRSIAADKGRIRRFSNVIDIADYAKPVPPAADLKQPCLLLLGSFGRANSPMDRAAVWTAREIMPLVWEQVPDAHLYIIGRNADRTQSSLASDRVSIIGTIPSVLGYLQHATATLVPLRYESGTRFKIIESGAAGIACVSTTLGAEGLDVEHGRNILIAETTEAFAAAIVDVLRKPDFAAALGNNLRDLVGRKYSLEVQLREGEEIIRYLERSEQAQKASVSLLGLN